jgi:hypothetical protein
LPEPPHPSDWRYLNATVSVLDGGINRRIEEQVENLRIMEGARKRFSHGT